MARLLRIERAIRWMAKVLTANRDALPFPTGITDQINPTIDLFGSQRMGEVQHATVLGGVGNVEAFHTEVPDDFVRFYLSLEFSHDDPISRRLRPGRIVRTAAGFPFAGMETEILAPTDDFFAVRNFTVGPLQRASVTANGMAAGAQMTITVLWIETPLGEYVRSIE